MRKVIFPLAFIGTSTLVACSFNMKAGSGAQDPNNPNTQPSTTPAPPPSTPAPGASTVAQPANPGPIKRLGRRPAGQPSGPTPTPTSSGSTTPTPPPTPSGAPVITGQTIFGSGTASANSFKGNIYLIPAGATKIPALASLQPNGYLFTPSLNITSQAFTTGFPGVDATRKENFAIRYESPLVVTAEADYDFRVVSDDGAILLIDNTPIVDNDGARTTAAEKSGPVHLVPGTHLLTIDYLQTGGNVALQVFCKKANDTEKVCTTQL